MFSKYAECEIDIQPRSGDSFPLSVHAPGGDARGVLCLPDEDPAFQALLRRLATLDTDEQLLDQIGQLLFTALFPHPIKEVLVRTQGTLIDGQGLRIKLNIASGADAVAALPWEFIHDPDHRPLAMLDISIVRYLQQSALIPRLKTNLPLRMLLTGAQPRELEQINIDQELREVEAALADLVGQGHVQLVVEPHLTRSKLQQLLRQGFHVWHFSGHGGFRSTDKSGLLAFEDTQGDLEWASARELGILVNRSSVRLIMLDACESGQLATSPFSNMASTLIYGQIPAVIAMQFKVPDAATRAFAGEFYRALAEGFPIDACVTEGRKAIMGAVGLGRPDWGIPVVYTRAPDGRLFELPQATPLPQTPTPAKASIMISGNVTGDIVAGSIIKDSSHITVYNSNDIVVIDNSAADCDDRPAPDTS
ncbi:MAG: CHAT domain-containing protein [Roseiflexaceae bacterium]